MISFVNKTSFKTSCKRLIAKFFVRAVSFFKINGADFTCLSNDEKKTVAQLLVKLVYLFRINKADFSYFDMFEYWEKNGFHIIPNHFYQPLPNISLLSNKLFTVKSNLTGMDMNEKKQIELLTKIFPKFKREYNQIPHQPTENPADFHFGNGAFDGLDALVLYCMIRYFKPQKIIEIGSGWSTRIAAQACIKNGQTKLYSIEPYPYEILKKGFPGLTKLIPKKVEDMKISFFNNLNENDILFIDSSHVIKIGGDVVHLFLEVLPRLKKGVIIHVHDIFLPYNYPKNWVLKEYRFWNEQYLLQAFLTYNHKFEILFANNYMGSKYKTELKKIFFNSPTYSGGSIWLRKV